MPLLIAGRLLRRSAEVNGAGDGAVLGINDGDIGRLMAKDIDSFGAGLEEDAIRPAFDRLLKP
jgi:hypothetical protein